MLEMQINILVVLIIVVYLVTIGIFFTKSKQTIDDQREAFAFRCMLFSFMVYGLVDLRFLFPTFYTSFPGWFVTLVTELGFASMALACYFWFIYVSTDTRQRRKYAVKWYVVTSIPLLITMALIFTPFNKNLFEINEILLVKPAIALITWLDYIYLILATIISAIKMHKSKTKIEKRKYRTEIFFIIFFTSSGFLVGFLMGLPSIELCIIPVVVKIFVDVQDSKIYTDALTRLNNRIRISDYFKEEIKNVNDTHPLCIIMIDIDFFKSINDILGHDEGDKTLIAFSDALAKITASKNAMASRWGGDEFIVATRDKALTENFREKLNSKIENSKEISFIPSFSLGMYECTDTSISIDQALIEADKNLYKNKEIQHQQTDAFHERLKALKS